MSYVILAQSTLRDDTSIRQTSVGPANTRLVLSAYWLATVVVGLAVVFRLSPVYEVDRVNKDVVRADNYNSRVAPRGRSNGVVGVIGDQKSATSIDALAVDVDGGRVVLTSQEARKKMGKK